jgi:GH15 family glucan-1,4-alpha-glucosidase
MFVAIVAVAHDNLIQVSKRCEESSKGDGSLQIMYGIHGEHELIEQELPHLAGYCNSKPVRIGNGAFDQIQLDIYGELLDTVYLSNKYAEPISYDFWLHVRKMVDWICIHWSETDEGIWLQYNHYLKFLLYY